MIAEIFDKMMSSDILDRDKKEDIGIYWNAY